MFSIKNPKAEFDLGMTIEASPLLAVPVESPPLP
jgi:hypothetical protein